VYGQKFGDAGINIAGMQVARRTAGGEALTVLTVDSRVPEELLDAVGEAIEASAMKQIEITEV
ncbi:MAG: phosphoglycerate dehydrogenase, partial [Microbacterium sp.]